MTRLNLNENNYFAIVKRTREIKMPYVLLFIHFAMKFGGTFSMFWKHTTYDDDMKAYTIYRAKQSANVLPERK